MKKILITGANSFVGTNVEKRLLKEPNKYYIETLDMRDPKWKEFNFSNFNIVFHVAGIAHVSTKKRMNDLYFEVNRDLAIETIKKHELDWLFIIGWSQIAKKDVLNTPKKGCIGMHPTLLPEGRGRAAIPWAIIKKLDKTGVTMFKLDEGVDTGDIILQGEIPLHPSITATELYSKVNEMHVELIRRSWNDIVLDKLKLIPQDNSKATEWLGRTPSDGEIFPTMTMDEAETLVRATTHPYPGAFYIKKDKKTIVWSAEKNQHSGDLKLSDGYLIIKEKTIENV